MAITKKRFWAGARRGLPTIFQDRVDVAAGRACELPTLPMQVQFPVLFPQNVEPHRVGFENRRDLEEFLTG
jgi:hypothetical protein